LAELAGISERRLERLVNPDLSGIPAFLSRHPGLSSGYMMLQVMAAALVSENKILAHPVSVDSTPTSANKEDPRQHGDDRGAEAEGRIVQNVETVLAAEILAACQAMEFRKPLRPGRGPGKAHALVRSHIRPLEEDRETSPDLECIRRLIQKRAFQEILMELQPRR